MSVTNHPRIGSQLIYQLCGSTVKYTVTAGPDSAAQALVTVDNPQVVFSLDPIYALAEFAVAPFKNATSAQPSVAAAEADEEDTVVESKSSSVPLSYRVEIRHATVLVLASDTDKNAQAIELRIKDTVVAQQVRVS